MKEQLKQLKTIEQELHLLGGVSALLSWDRATAIPKKAVPQRAEQSAYLSTLIHEKLTSKELKNIIQQLSKNSKSLSSLDQCIVKKYQKDLQKIEKIPKKHVEEFSRLCTQSEHAWEEARTKQDFSLFAPYLEKVLRMKLQEAKYVNATEHPYNVLLDDFEEGMTFQKIDPVFTELKNGLREIIRNIQKSTRYKQQKNIFKQFQFPVEAQKEITKDIKNRILGEHSERHTDAVSMHPFTTRISDDDVRITTAYREGQPLFSFTSTAHEAGHALYELGFAEQLHGTILCDAPSFGVHESQSRFWENHITKSREFWNFYYPLYQQKFPDLQKMPKEEFYRQVNVVKPSLVRIECDEVTYCLHIVIRYELEKALLEGKLKIKNLPTAWNKKYQEYLGVTPKHAAEGVLQDMHWSEGLFGYFPTYALGTMYSAMIFNQLKQEHPAVMKEIARGNFSPVSTWLREKIHKHGATMLTGELIHTVCKKELTPRDFLEYLKEKYYPLYGIK